jgi:pyruvate kinase
LPEKDLVTNAMAAAAVDSAYRIKAKLIIAFTSSGSLAMKLSKLKPPCHILAVTSSGKISR